LARECRNPARYQIGGECGISGACCRAAAQAMAQAATAALFTIIALVDIEESFRSVPFRSLCDTASWSFSRRAHLTERGGMKNQMAGRMAVDAALWLLLAAMIGWVALGCMMTARHPRPSHGDRLGDHHGIHRRP